jgi:hypothetical protein
MKTLHGAKPYSEKNGGCEARRYAWGLLEDVAVFIKKFSSELFGMAAVLRYYFPAPDTFIFPYLAVGFETLKQAYNKRAAAPCVQASKRDWCCGGCVEGFGREEHITDIQPHCWPGV